MVADSTSEPEAGCGGRRRGFKWKLRPIRRNRRHGYRRLRPDVPHKRRAAPLHTYNHPLSYLNISAACLWTYGMCKYLLHTFTHTLGSTYIRAIIHIPMYLMYINIFIYRSVTHVCVYIHHLSLFIREICLYIYIIYIRVCTEVSTRTYIYIVCRHISTIIHMYVWPHVYIHTVRFLFQYICIYTYHLCIPYVHEIACVEQGVVISGRVRVVQRIDRR